MVPRGVSSILKRYDITTHKTMGRKVYRTKPEAIAAIGARYGYDMDGSDHES